MMTNLFSAEELAALRAPFPLDWHIIREGYTSGGKMRWFAYIDRSAVQDLLDEVFPGEWETTEPKLYFSQTQNIDRDGLAHVVSIVSATVGITIRGLTRWDGGDSEGDESTKGALTNAFRRTAAYGWGVGRYLYDMTEPISTVTWNKGDWQKRNEARKDAWEQFTRWYTQKFGAQTRQNAPERAPQQAQAQPTAAAPSHTQEQVQQQDGTVPFVPPGDKEWYNWFWTYAHPLYDEANYVQNHRQASFKKLMKDGVIRPDKQSVQVALDALRKHLADKQEQTS
jgi:hypothetical protein